MGITWPATLPQFVNQDGFSQETGDNLIRTQTDTGPAKQRRRYTAVPTTIDATLLLNRAQLADFMTFYSETLEDGALSFDWVWPLTQAACTMRFRSKYKISAPKGLYVTVSLPLEVLP